MAMVFVRVEWVPVRSASESEILRFLILAEPAHRGLKPLSVGAAVRWQSQNRL